MTFAATGRKQDRKSSGLTARLLLFAVVAFLIALVILSRLSPTRFDHSRLWVQQLAAPVVWIYEAPVSILRDSVRYFSDYLHVHDENRILKAELERLEPAQQRLEGLERENLALRRQLDVAAWPSRIIASGRVLSHGGGTYLKSVLVAAGSDNGVKPGQAAVSKDGLVGQVVAVSGRLSRVLLLNDFSSRMPVVVDATQTPGIAQGTNASRLKLSFLPIDFIARQGARVSTSGAGGVFPAGLPVGTILVTDTSKGPIVEIVPYADLSAAGYLTFLTAPDVEQPRPVELPPELAGNLAAANAVPLP
ncbi:MAG: rod shape-determining protein MreC [Sphingomonadales bacterium]